MSAYNFPSEFIEIGEQEAIQIGSDAVNFIIEGDTSGEPFNLVGQGVFGVIRALRENDPRLHGDQASLTPEQKLRLESVEAAVDAAVGVDAQYFPFGHKMPNKYETRGDNTYRQLSDQRNDRTFGPVPMAKRGEIVRQTRGDIRRSSEETVTKKESGE